MSRHEEEYTDYSCSTAIEGLSRDVETVLRTWHVDRGSDRHVSVGKRKSSQDPEDPSASLIRSNTIIWQFSVTTAEGRSSVTIDLELALWDAPGDAIVLSEMDDDDQDSTLVRSLRRLPLNVMASHDYLFDNFSTLFGVGQHISLTPIQPEPMPADLAEYLGNSLLQRHDEKQTVSWVLGSTLSGWLQSALNCAVSNCQCCIPAFGVWGEYRPNQLLPATSSNRSTKHSQMNQSTRSNHSDTTDTLLGTTIHTKSQIVSTGVPIFPKWIESIQGVKLPTVGRRFRARAQKFWNHRFVPPFVNGTVISPSGALENPGTAATMSISASKNGIKGVGVQNRISKRSRLSVWASVLLEHCEDATVVLCGARHVFGYFKPRKENYRNTIFQNLDDDYIIESQKWRRVRDITASKDEANIYRQQCRETALGMLEDAWGERRDNIPIWGPVDDPVASVYATTTWNGTVDGNGNLNALLTFPLRIRSRRELSKRDYIEMEESIEKTILDPLAPSRFSIQVFFDHDASVTTMAANQRCILATLIRAATLPGETLLQHLTEEELVELWDDNAGTIVANKLADTAKVGSTTRQLVEVMEWSGVMEDMISVREAEAIVHAVMRSGLDSSFPDSPDNAFTEIDGILSPFRKSAPWGRLLGVLFTKMAKLRELSSMALVWGVFIDELRRRWEMRESLPNMQYVPGLDPHPLHLYSHRGVSSIGRKADYAAFLNCSEPDPDDYNCLIGQKLQVFNLGVECVVASEMMESEALEHFLGTGEIPATSTRHSPIEEPHVDLSMGPLSEPNVPDSPIRFKKETDSVVPAEEKTNYAPPTVNADLEFWVMDAPGHGAAMDEGFDTVEQAKDPSDDFHFASPITTLVANGDSPTTESVEVEIVDSKSSPADVSMDSSQDFYDAAEAGSIFSAKNDFVTLDTGMDKAGAFRRPGARCPVQGLALQGTGDQLFAPYLQRSPPLTDDLVLERRVMLSYQGDNGNRKGVLQSRLELANRLQRPKLYSDMCAFKAANPGCSIDDFSKWYGNPGSPLDDYQDYNDPVDSSTLEEALKVSKGQKLDKASEAMKVLTSTRDFWGATWEAATPIPASEQQPLFDFTSTVEMVIDYLEQLHPANLLNQVMAVNLSSAYFTLVTSAQEAAKIELINSTIQNLRHKINKALQILSKDSLGESIYFPNADTNGSVSHTNPSNSSNSNRFASVDSIRACEEACNSLSVAETMIARALSLLEKFPGQYTFVQDLLRLKDGSKVPLTDPKGRSYFLNEIHNQQKQHPSFAAPGSLPQPVLREYVFRNLDDGSPCQLSVRFGDAGAYLDRVDNEGGVLLALLKSYSD